MGSGYDESYVQLRDLLIISREINRRYTEMVDYLADASLQGYSDNPDYKRHENLSRQILKKQLLALVLVSCELPEVKTKLADRFKKGDISFKNIPYLRKQIEMAEQEKIPTHTMVDWFLEYSSVLSSAGLLSAYNKSEAIMDKFRRY